MKNRFVQIGAGAITELFNTILSILGGIITIPLLLSKVGVEHYGLFIIVSAIVGFVNIGNLGFPSAITNQISFYWAEEKKREISELFSGALYFYSFILASIWSIFGILYFTHVLSINQLIGTGPELEPLVVKLFLILLFFTSIKIIFGNIFTSVFNGLNKISLLNTISFFYTLFYTFSFIAFLIYANPTIIQVVLFQGIAVLIRLMILFVFILKKFSWLTIVPHISCLRSFYPLLKHSFSFFVLSTSSDLIGKTDLLVLSHVIGVSAAPLFSINEKIFRIPANAVQIADPAQPSISHFYQLKNFNEISRIYHRVIRMHMIIRIMVILFIAVYGKELIALWVGNSFFVSYWLVALFCINFLLYSWIGPHIVFMNAIFKQTKAVVPMILNLSINVFFSIILAQKIGIAGIVIGTILGNLLTNAHYIPHILSKELSIHPFKELSHLGISFILPILFILSFHYGSLVLTQNLFIILLLGAINGLCFFLYIYRFILEPSERQFFHVYFEKFRKRFHLYAKTVS